MRNRFFTVLAAKKKSLITMMGRLTMITHWTCTAASAALDSSATPHKTRNPLATFFRLGREYQVFPLP